MATSLEKPEALHINNKEKLDDDEQPQPQGDYSGAREKTDPAEIKLVKKLDRWIMVREAVSLSNDVWLSANPPILLQPMLWIMFWLNYLDRNAIALARLNDLEEDLNLTDTGMQ